MSTAARPAITQPHPAWAAILPGSSGAPSPGCCGSVRSLDWRVSPCTPFGRLGRWARQTRTEFFPKFQTQVDVPKRAALSADRSQRSEHPPLTAHRDRARSRFLPLSSRRDTGGVVLGCGLRSSIGGESARTVATRRLRRGLRGALFAHRRVSMSVYGMSMSGPGRRATGLGAERRTRAPGLLSIRATA